MSICLALVMIKIYLQSEGLNGKPKENFKKKESRHKEKVWPNKIYCKENSLHQFSNIKKKHHSNQSNMGSYVIKIRSS